MTITDFMPILIEFLIYVCGVLVLIAGLLYVIWWSIGQIIKLSGYWKLFYRALMIAGREAYEEKRRKNKK